MLYSWNGSVKSLLTNVSEVQTAISAGFQIVDDTGFTYDNSINKGSLINVAGGYLLKGCPINTYFGVPITPAQATALVQNQGILTLYGYTSCLQQAMSMIGNPGTAGATTPTSNAVSNVPSAVSTDATAGAGQPSAASYQNSTVAQSIAPSVPSGLPTGTGSSVGGQMLTTVYRFILAVGGGYATGANLQGCSQTNSAMCDPQFFTTLQQAIAYAYQQGQVPYAVASSNDPWALMAGTLAINPANIYNQDGSMGGSGVSSLFSMSIGGIPVWALAIGAYFLLKK